MRKSEVPIGYDNHILIDEERRAMEQSFLLFNQVSESPFEIVRYGRKMDHQDLIEDFSFRRRGACSAKHYYLGEQLSDLGLPVAYQTTPFLWSEMIVDYPAALKEKAGKMPLQHHLSLVANFGYGWKLLDATWDSPLAKVGFSIPDFDLGLEEIPLAVVPAGASFFHESAEGRFEFISQLKITMERVGIEDDFYFSFNQWLEQIRQM